MELKYKKIETTIKFECGAVLTFNKIYEINGIYTGFRFKNSVALIFDTLKEAIQSIEIACYSCPFKKIKICKDFYNFSILQ